MGLPYNEPDRGGIETEQSMIHLGVLGRLKKTRVVLRSNMSSPKNKASFREVDLVDTDLQLTASIQVT